MCISTPPPPPSYTFVSYDCGGTIRFVGPHASTQTPRIGVELDLRVGRNDGTINDHSYFTCEPKFGILVVPEKVTLVGIEAAAESAAAENANASDAPDADSYHSDDEITNNDEQFGGFEDEAAPNAILAPALIPAPAGVSVTLDTAKPLGMRLHPAPNGTGILIQEVKPGAQAAATGIDTQHALLYYY